MPPTARAHGWQGRSLSTARWCWEASLIVEGDHIAGPITSGRMPPTPRRSVCLAQPDARLARPGTEVTERPPSGRPIAATVIPQLAYLDPDGERKHA
jgi:Glycine cleavage T-protein C-terminal barrel domain